MNANRILYRTRQFWQALGASLTAEGWDLVRARLTPGQVALFERMQESERAHALRVVHALLEQGEEHPDLLVAALLHDVGKSRFPLKLWERVLIVLGQAFFPNLSKRWGSEPSNGPGLPTGAHSSTPNRLGLPTEAHSPTSDRRGLPTEAHSPAALSTAAPPLPRSPAPKQRSSLPLPGSPAPLLQLLRRAFVVAERHAEWGAEMAAGAGASRMAVALIRRHQDDLDRPGEGGFSLEEDLLGKLQSVDDDS